METAPSVPAPAIGPTLVVRQGPFRALSHLCRIPLAPRPDLPDYGIWQAAREEVHLISMWSKWLLSGLFSPPVPLYDDRAEMLRAAARTAPPRGLWLEFGVHRGRSINEIATLAPGPVYGFDSFEGLPRRWTPRYPVGAFNLDGGLPVVRSNVTLIKGWFDETVGPFLEQHPNDTVSLLHIDCDLYQSARTVLAAVQSRLRAGSVVLFDEFEGFFPDTEGRAFRELVRSTDRDFVYMGAGVFGAVALVIQ